MIDRLKVGDTVKVWPRPGLRVQAHAGIPGRFIPDEGDEMKWSPWLAARVADGSVLLTDPNARYAVATRDDGAAAEEARAAVGFEVVAEADHQVQPRELEPGEVLEAVAPPPGVVTERISADELREPPAVIHLEPPAEKAEKAE